MERSGRLFSASESTDRDFESSSSFRTGSRREPDQTSTSQGLGASLEGIDFVDVMRLCSRFDIPSVKIRRPGIVDDGVMEQQAISLGIGLTSQVVQHITDEDASDFVARGTIVALKVYDARNSSRMEGKKAIYTAVKREIEALAHPNLVGHPNIIDLLFVGWQNDNIFPMLGLEIGTHGSLDDFIKGQGAAPSLDMPSLDLKIHISADIAQGLLALHRAGFVHGDLKPDNIILVEHSDPARRIIARLNRPSSSFLVSFMPSWMEDDPGDFLWCIKSAGQMHDILDAYTTAADAEGKLQNPRATRKMLDILTPALNVRFWLRPSVSSLISNLRLMAVAHAVDWASREEYETRQAKIKCQSNGRSNIKVRSDIAIKVEIGPHGQISVWQLELALKAMDTASTLDDFEVADVPAQLAENLSTHEYLFLLFEGVEQLFKYPDKSALESAAQYETRCANYDDCGVLAESLGIHKVSHAHSGSDEEEALKLLFVAARHGRRLPVTLATFMAIDTPMERKLPIRLLLSLLALSRSQWALERLSARWPTHHRLIQSIILERSPTCTSHHGEAGIEWIYGTLQLYVAQPVRDDLQLTLEEALSLGAADDVKMILTGDAIPRNQQETVSRLLHGLSYLTDADAAAMVELAYDQGADLDILRPVDSPISPMMWFDSLAHLGELSPLTAAVRRGKILLAHAILDLHVKLQTSILDFDRALEISFIYLHHELCARLLDLVRAHPSLCGGASLLDDCDSLQPPPEFLFQLILVSGRPATTHMRIEKLAMHGGGHDAAYARTIEICLREGLEPIETVGGFCPMLIALETDDVVAAKLFLEHMASRRDDVGEFLRLPWVLQTCISKNSVRCFELLIKAFPEILIHYKDKHGRTLLHHACASAADADFVRLLLEAGADVSARDNSANGVTSLALAIVEENLEKADIIASSCTTETIKSLVSQDPKTGTSIFMFLLLRWGSRQRTPILDRLRWLKDKCGVHFFNDEGLPIWFLLVSRPRPFLRSDQFHERQFMEYLLDIPSFWDKVNTARVRGLTLLHVAAGNGHIDIVRMLVRRGCDINVRVGTDALPTDRRSNEQITRTKWTAVDYMGTRFLGAVPEEVRRGGPLEVRTWYLDLQEIRDFLFKSGIESWVVERSTRELRHPTSLEDFVEKAEKRLQKLRDTEADSSKTRQAIAPRLGDAEHLVTCSTNAEQLSTPDLCETHLGRRSHCECCGEKVPPLDDKDLAGWEALSGKWQNQRRETETYPRDYAAKIKRDSARLRQSWRLPPDWTFVDSNEDEGCRGRTAAFYYNTKTCKTSLEKPPLYRDTPGGSDPASTTQGPGKNTSSKAAPRDAVVDDGASLSEEDVADDINPDIRALAEKMASILEPSKPRMHTKPQDIPPSRSNKLSVVISSQGDVKVVDDKEARNFTDKDGNTFLHLAAAAGHIESLSEILAKFPELVIKENHLGLTALQTAITQNQPRAVRALLAHGASPTTPCSSTTMPPIHLAVIQRSVEIVELLLSAGADPNVRVDSGALKLTPLHTCVLFGDEEDKWAMIRALVRGGVDLNIFEPNDNPLNLAVTMGRTGCLRTLLSCGADPALARITGPNGSWGSVLHAACIAGNVDIAEMLLDRGMDIDSRDGDGMTPLVHAFAQRQHGMVEFLLGRGADIGVAREFREYLDGEEMA